MASRCSGVRYDPFGICLPLRGRGCFLPGSEFTRSKPRLLAFLEFLRQLDLPVIPLLHPKGKNFGGLLCLTDDRLKAIIDFTPFLKSQRSSNPSQFMRFSMDLFIEMNSVFECVRCFFVIPVFLSFEL